MDEPGVAAVERALSIVGAFGAGGEPMTLNDIALKTGFYKSTILRLLASLERHHCVLRLADGRYQLGPAFLHWGNIFQRSSRLENHVMPVLQRLAQETGESASFYVRQGDQRLCLFRVDSAHSVRDHVRVGDLLPLDRGAAGRILRDGGIDGTAPPKAEIIVTRGERDPETAAVAAPVYGPSDILRGVLSLSSPISRFTSDLQRRSSALLREAAAELTQRLGGSAALVSQGRRPAQGRKPTAGRRA
jgi:DNA-binding IclR family transcriptional regulator